MTLSFFPVAGAFVCLWIALALILPRAFHARALASKGSACWRSIRRIGPALALTLNPKSSRGALYRQNALLMGRSPWVFAAGFWGLASRFFFRFYLIAGLVCAGLLYGVFVTARSHALDDTPFALVPYNLAIERSAEFELAFSGANLPRNAERYRRVFNLPFGKESALSGFKAALAEKQQSEGALAVSNTMQSLKDSYFVWPASAAVVFILKDRPELISPSWSHSDALWLFINPFSPSFSDEKASASRALSGSADRLPPMAKEALQANVESALQISLLYRDSLFRLFSACAVGLLAFGFAIHLALSALYLFGRVSEASRERQIAFERAVLSDATPKPKAAPATRSRSRL